MRQRRAYVRFNRWHPIPKAALEAFAIGLKAHGWVISDSPCLVDMWVQWGLADLPAFKHIPRCVLEMGYLGDRAKHRSVAFGGLNGRGTFYGVQDDPKRWNTLGLELQPFGRDRPDDSYVLIIGQVPGDFAVQHTNFASWVLNVHERLKLADFPDIRFRPHPRAALPRPGLLAKLRRVCMTLTEFELQQARLADARLTLATGNLADNLASASRVITFSSNTAVDAVLAGRAVVAMDEGSMARAVAGSELLTYYKPADSTRQRWAHRLAWKQWTDEELASGECWDIVQPPDMRALDDNLHAVNQ